MQKRRGREGEGTGESGKEMADSQTTYATHTAIYRQLMRRTRSRKELRGMKNDKNVKAWKDSIVPRFLRKVHRKSVILDRSIGLVLPYVLLPLI